MKTVEDAKFINGLRQLTGVKIRLLPHEEIHTHQASELQIMVSVRTYTIQETSRETRYKAAAWKIYTIKRANADDARWYLADVSTIPDSGFEPYVLRHYGRTDTPVEATERRRWEDLCHRPGTPDYPLESLAVTEDLAMNNLTTPKMRKHWNV